MNLIKFKSNTKKSSLFYKENRAFLVMVLPASILCFLIAYMPMFGTILAFKKYDVRKGIFFSPWAGFKNFEFFIMSQDFSRITRNTILLNFMFIIVGVITSVGLALMLNEIRSKWFSKITQSILFLPSFISWTIVGYFLYAFLSMESGIVNNVLKYIGVTPIMWYNEAQHWPVILLVCSIWKGAGSGCVIYLAGMVGISDEYYDAAKIDGANKRQIIFNITIPFIMPLIVTLSLLAIGRIMYSDFGMFYNLTKDSGSLYPTTDVIDTYVYRALRKNSDTGMAAAATFYQSILGFLLILLTNFAVRKYDKDYALF